jgi:hypothetical protein
MRVDGQRRRSLWSDAAAGCRVDYAVTSQWQTGFGANVTITNLGDPINGWTLTWTYAAGQQVTQAWNATVTQSGGQVTARNAGYNVGIATNANVAFGFNASWSGSNPVPASFTVNGTVCTGGVDPSTGPPTSSPSTSASPSTPPPSGSLPNSFRWRSSGPLIAPKSDATHNILAVKDPSVVYHNGRYHVFASTANSSGNYSLVYMNFTDWSQAGSAQHHYLDQTPVGGGYKAAPHVFFFTPQNRW